MIYNQKVKSFFFLFLILIVCVLIPDYKTEMVVFKLRLYIIILVLSLYYHATINLSLNWFRIDLIFLLGFSIVHFQWVWMISFTGITPDFFLRDPVNYYYITYGTWLSLIGILSWMFGYNMINTEVNTKKSEMNLNYNALLYFNFIILFLFLVFAGDSYLNGSVYKGLTNEKQLTGVSIYFYIILNLSSIVLLSASILKVTVKENLSFIKLFNMMDKKFIIFSMLYVFIFIYSGDRGGAIRYVFCFLILYGMFIQPISLKRFFLIIVLGSVVVSLLGIGRAISDGGNILALGMANSELSSFSDSTIELANSARVLHYSLDHISSSEGYLYGKLWLGHVLALIPFAQSFYLEISGDLAYELTSAEYITYIIYGKNSINGAGSGLIAEFYLNFGFFGVLICSFLFGIFVKLSVNGLMVSKNSFWVASGAVLSSYVFYISRGGIELRPFLWSWLILVIFTVRKYR
jgi:oligosaccharide repeat unit polymerase